MRLKVVRGGMLVVGVSVCSGPLAAQPLDNNFITTLGTYLGYGTIGLGLAVAVLAALVLLTRGTVALAGGTRFMMFGLALVLIGAGIELMKSYNESIKNEREFISELNLPDEFWKDFLFSRKQEMFGTAEPTDEIIDGTLKESEERDLQVFVPNGQCRYYFVATKPPARTAVFVEGSMVIHRPFRDKEYYQTGKICIESDKDADQVNVTVRMLDGDGKFTAAAYVAPPEEVVGSKGVAEINKVVCTGEFQQNCAGPFDIFMGCGAPGDKEIAEGVCSSFGRNETRFLRINTKGGNRCGYSLIQVTCL